MYETNEPIKKYRKLRYANGEHLINIPSEIVYRLDLETYQECRIEAYKDKLALAVWFKPKPEVVSNETQPEHTEP